MYETYTFDNSQIYPITKHTASDIQDSIDKNEERYREAAKKLQKKYKVVIDFSNGSGCTREYSLVQKIQQQSIRDIICINTAADGTFPGHESDTSNPECYEQLIDVVSKQQADI